MTEVRRLRKDEIEPLVEDLWIPFSEEMADLDPYNELADEVFADAIAYRRERFADGDVATYVAVEGGDLVGYASVEYRETPPVFSRGPEANVGEVYVDPDHRERGVASALVDAAEEWAAERGAERATLAVNARNAAAKRLYEKRGYGVRRHRMDRTLE